MKAMVYLIVSSFGYALALKLVIASLAPTGDASIAVCILAPVAWLGAMITTGVTICNSCTIS